LRSSFGDGVSKPSEGSEQPSSPDGGAVVRLLLAVSVFFLLLGAWSWTNRVEFVSGVDERMLLSDDLAALGVVEVGKELLMTSDADEHWVLADGFDTPEADGTWIVDLDARIILEAAEDSPRQISLKFYPFLAGDIDSREIEVRTSAGAVSAIIGDGVNEISAQLDGTARQVVDITCSSVDSPLDLGVGTDVRTLCAKLLSVYLVAD